VAQDRRRCARDGTRAGVSIYGQALQAAIDGLGIAMGIRPYIDDDLARTAGSRHLH